MLSASMTEKRRALASLVKDVLDAHGFRTFTVEEEVPRLALAATADADRTTLMGKPIAYARVQHEGSNTPDDTHYNIQRGVSQNPHRFGVRLWYEIDITSETAYAADQAEWDLLIESDDFDAPGLLVSLRDAGAISAGNQIIYRGVPEDVYVVYGAVSIGLWTAYCEFAITIT